MTRKEKKKKEKIGKEKRKKAAGHAHLLLPRVMDSPATCVTRVTALGTKGIPRSFFIACVRRYAAGGQSDGNLKPPCMAQVCFRKRLTCILQSSSQAAISR